MRRLAKGTLAILLLLSAISATNAAETHIFLGKWVHEIPDEWLAKGGRLPLKIEDSYVVAGDYARGTEVTLTGSEAQPGSHHVCLSCRPSVLGGGDGRIKVEYPAAMSFVEIVFWDESGYGIPFVDGADLEFSCYVGDIVRLGLQNLSGCQLGGDPKMRQRHVHQFIRPLVSGPNVGQEWELKIHAGGYDHFEIVRISFYDFLPTELSIGLECGGRGKRSRVSSYDWDRIWDGFTEWVLRPIRSKVEAQKKPEEPERWIISTAGSSGKEPNMAGKWLTVSGDWDIQDKRMVQHDHSSSGYLIAKTKWNYTSLFAHFAFKILRAPKRERMVGCSFRGEPRQDFYYYVRAYCGNSGGDDHFELRKRTRAGKDILLDRAPIRFVAEGDKCYVAIWAKRGKLKARFYDGMTEAIVEASDSEYHEGEVGFITSGAVAKFYEVSIHQTK